MGASILNLSVLGCNDAKQRDCSDDSRYQISVDWPNCNYLGGDLNPAFVNFGNGIVSRDRRRIGRVSFVHRSAEELMANVLSYPGPISLIMIHFPSPYKLASSRGKGNSQLPSEGAVGFMVTTKLLQNISDLLCNNKSCCGIQGGLFIFQTKCEDVAVNIKQLCESLESLECVQCKKYIIDIERIYEHKARVRPKRVDDWLDANPSAERAEGEVWSSVPLLPLKGRPETEIQCEHDNSVVHRCMFRCNNDSS